MPGLVVERDTRIAPPRLTGVEPLYVEVSSLLARNLTGIARFVARLVEALSRITPLRLVTTIQGEHARSMRLSTALLCGQEIPVEVGSLPFADGNLDAWARKLLRRPRYRHDFDLASRAPGLYTLLRPAKRHFARELCIFYDFTPLLLPWVHVPETLEHFGKFFAESSGVCDKGVAISESTRTDASWLAALPASDIVVGYPGPSLCVHEHAFSPPVTRRRNVILVVSTLEPRKNGRFLLDWFANTDALASDSELWWVGPNGWMCNWEQRSRNRSGMKRSIRFLGMVPDDRLCELYRQATFSIYPSLYEGFGFPVLDSLRHGTPVACSFNSSLEEFAGPGIYYFDACDPKSLDEACCALLADQPQPVERFDLDERFSWAALARTVLSLARN